jgi:hypothetical protein
MIDMWICNGFVVIYDSNGRLRKGVSQEAKPEE